VTSGHRGAETDFELTVIERLEAVGYTHTPGPELHRDRQEVILVDDLGSFLTERYPELPEAAVEFAIKRLSRPEGVDTIHRNLDFHTLATKGFEVPVDGPGKPRRYVHVHPIDWQRPEDNRFRVVNQLAIHGNNDRRPDVLLYVNGFPIVLFELKNPWEPNFTVEHAHNQVAHYRHDIPQVFEFNALTVISDGVTTLHGQWPASLEWFAPWKSIDGETIEANTTGSMKTLVEGLLTRDRLLAYVRDFVLFERVNDTVGKKAAKYHQFFAVQKAVDRTLESFDPSGSNRVGVIWHTTGSGKSLSMVFLVGILRRAPQLKNPAIVIQVDATDLDSQLYDQFLAARELVGDAQHADTMEDLRTALRTEGGELVFSTLQKFQLRKGETSHPVLSERSNIVVIADEAHRSQYGFLQGYARYLRDALPNAKFLGFTGTPVSFASADTAQVFGDVIDTYDIKQSQLDGTTVPIYYEPRMVQLHLSGADIDEALKELASGEDPDELERRKSRWAALAAAAGAEDRVEDLAADLLAHFTDRTATLEGKAMIVGMTRANCVKLYNALTALPGCPEVKIVMTGDLMRDPEEWSKAGHITTKAQREAIKARMVDPDDPLKIVIVCDMWLTGTDIPVLHTLYIDKPMKDHSIIQAISRVNRVFEDKPHGLVVDYIGIGDELRAATTKYSSDGGRGEPAPNIEDEARPIFVAALAEVQSVLPEGIDYADWPDLSRIQLEDRFSLVYGSLTDDEDRRDAFLAAETKLSRAFLLVKHLDDCRLFADELVFFQQVRKQVLKALPGSGPSTEVDRAVRDLVDDSITASGVVDIFKVAGLEHPDLSILDDQFLQTFKDRPGENLRLKLLEKLLSDEVRSHERRNLTQARSLRELLEKTLAKYHNRIIDAAAVIQEMIQIRSELEKSHRRAEELGVTEEELAFYDAIAANVGALYDEPFLKDLVHDVVTAVKRYLRVDWTAPHRDDVRAAIRSAVKRTLRARGVEADHFDLLVESVMEQATVSFQAWPQAA
jgi:type I restriction enzyme, R subunit